MTTTLSDSESLSSEFDDVDEDGNYTASMAISSVDAATHLDQINEEEGDDLEENPIEDEVVPETNFIHYQFSENEEENDNKEFGSPSTKL